MHKLTLQIFLNHQWQDIVELLFNETYQLAEFNYLTEYVAKHFSEQGSTAVSINYPVDFFVDERETNENWLAFLNDIMLAGASRRYWLDALDIHHLPLLEQNYILLSKGTISPVGNLRIKEAVPTAEESVRYFALDDVMNRAATDFLEYANQNGAIVGGATGAGGEAPKLLLRKKANQVWIDNQQHGNDDGGYYLVKYPRERYSERDCDILRTEYHYYHEIASMGFNTIDTKNMRLEEGESYPSLWLPRFDIVQDSQGKIIQRYALESVYSLLKKGGGLLDHMQVLQQIISLVNASSLDSQPTDEFVLEWVKRDLLNIAFGNSDNHGRNTSFLKDQNSIWIAPIYDFAPMRADLEEITRTMTWQKPLENGGEYRFESIAEHLSEFIEPERLLQELKVLASQLVNLKERLEKRGIPHSILSLPKMAFDYLPEKLQRWGLV